MRLMRNIRTGSKAAYDEDLIETGRWEEYFPASEPVEKSKRRKAGGGPVDKLGCSDEISIVMTKANKPK